MERELEKYLHILNSEVCVKNPKEAEIVINKLYYCFKKEQSQFTVGLLIGLILEENNGIFSFIWNTCSDFETIPSAALAIKLLNFLITDYQKCTEAYFNILFEKCLHLVNTKFAKVKELSLKLIKNLICANSEINFELTGLILALEKLLQQDNKLQGTVAEQVYILLGYIFEKYPESIKKKSNLFFFKMCECLRHEVVIAKNSSTPKIKGVFEALNGYLMNFSFPDDESIKKVYVEIKKFSKYQPEKKLLGRIALKILQNHWAIFSKLIFDDKDIWKNNLSVWLNQGTDDRLSGFYAFSAFYSVLAFHIKQNLENFEILGNYQKNFIEILSMKNSTIFEKKSALIGIKLFVLTDCIQEVNLDKTYRLVMDFIRTLEISENFAFLPLSIECMSAFVLKFSSMEILTLEHLAILQRLSVVLINEYPKIRTHLQCDALTALEKSFYIIGSFDLQLLENHLDKVLYQGFIRTCSYMTLVNLEILKEAGEAENDLITYKSFLSLWKYFMNLINSQNLPMGGSFELKKGIAIKVIDTILCSFIKIITKLNLSVNFKELNLEMEVEVSKPSDFQIFVNCVDLYQDLILLTDPFNLVKWMNKIFHVAINLSLKNPLVAGFYKIIKTTFKVCESLQFFDGNKNSDCFELLIKFLEQLITKVNQYKGDLQIVCLETILAAPASLIESFAEKTIPVLEVTFILGRNYFSLLKDLIETLERWNLNLSSPTFGAIIKKILPHFDLFFQSQYFQGSNVVNSSVLGKKLKKKILFKDSELLELQKKFLLFLGNLNVNLAINLIEIPNLSEEERNINENHLLYHPPLGFENVKINLDEILPRIIDLAMSCSDRQTRLIACELLYSAVMVIFGNINQVSGGNIGLFRKIIKTCLILGSDSDAVIYQIFEPLLLQITHYLSGKKATYFSETQALIDILMDYVTRPYDLAVRDLSARLICEFTTWSIKQVTSEELKAIPDSLNKILNYIYSFALHPSYNKRIGAVVVFNKIYPVLREDDFILDVHWFQLFYYFVESLRMCDGPENPVEILEAIQHVKSPLIEKFQNFNKISKDRVIPPEFEGELLCDLVKWAFKRSYDSSRFTRRIMMVVVEELAPLVSECKSLSTFVEKYVTDKSFIMLEKQFDLSNIKEEYFIDWLHYQCASFEYYSWLFSQNVLTPQQMPILDINKMIQKYILGIQAFKKERNLVMNCMLSESVVLFLKLLDTLKEKAFYFCKEIWDFLKIAVFKPNDFGFDLYQAATIENLILTLSNLLKYFYDKLTQYNWISFYENLSSLIIVPFLRHIIVNRTVNLIASEFLFGLRVIVNAGIWEDFIKQTFFTINGNFILEIVFRSLFYKQRKIIYALSLDISCKLYLEKLLKIAYDVGVDLETILNFIKNSEAVKDEETGKSTTKGEFFQMQFRDIIEEILKTRPQEFVEWVLKSGNIDGVKLLVQVLKNEKSENEEGKLQLEVFSRWKEFEKFEMKTIPSKLKRKILLSLANSAAHAVGTPGCLKVTSVADSIYAVLESQNFDQMDLDEIENVLNLLPFLSLLGEKLEDNYKLETNLSKFLTNHSHLKYEKSKNLLKHNILELIINGLLKSLKLTASLIVFRLSLTVTSWFETFSKKEIVESALSVFANVPVEHTIAALKLAFHACFENDKINSSPALLYKWFLNPLLNISSNAAVYEIVVENLEKMFTLITTTWALEEKSLNLIRTDIIRKTCVASILGNFVTKLSSKEMDRMPKDKKIFMEKMVIRCFPLLREPQPSLVLKDRYRKFMCEIFNMICCIISSRCTDPKFYKLFLFDERGSFLFVAVDTTFKYHLGMDFDVIPKRKKFSILLRKKVTEEVQSNINKTIKTVKYIQTNTLFSSSLKEDVTKFDLSSTSIRPMDFINNYGSEEFQEIELEVDEINNHECMAPLVGVITKMVKDNITPLPKNDEHIELPCWLTFFLGVLKNTKFSKNLKLFVVKALYNVQSYVKPFAKEVFSEVLDFISNFFSDYPINYLLIDLIEMLIDWKYVPADEIPRSQLTTLVETMIKKSDFPRKDIVKNNLEVIKTMIEVWKEVLYTSYLSDFVFEKFVKSVEEDIINKRNGSDGETYLNINVCGALLSNGISPWKKGSHKKFFSAILKHFTEGNKNKQIFSEICGLGLRHLEKMSVENFEECVELVRNKIALETDCWLPLLYGVHKHYPDISSKFIFRIFSSAWGSTDSFSVSRLEMIYNYVCRSKECEDDTFNRHAHSFLIDMLNSTDEDVQELSLQIVDKFFEKLDGSKTSLLLKEVFRLQKSFSPNVRKRVYEVSAKYYLKQSEEYDLKHQSKVVLLKGLNDGHIDLEKFCLKFWEDYLNFSSSVDVFIKIFREMYTPETENIFLSNTIKILIDCVFSKSSIEKSIFPHPIAYQSQFQKRSIVLGTKKSWLSAYISGGISKKQSLEYVATLTPRNQSFISPTITNLRFEPTVQEFSEKNPLLSSSSINREEMPKNPPRRRFFKIAKESNFSFGRWQMEKKKKEAKLEEESITKKEAQVDIFGEYRVGDYPDIEISHSQILKPLKALAVRDSQIARQFLVTFFSGLINSMKSNETDILLLETEKYFKMILQTTTNFDSGVFGFILEILLKNFSNFNIECEEITNAIMSSNCLSLGVLIMEKIVAQKKDLEEQSSKRRKACGNSQDKGWIELAKLYRGLNEHDALLGIFLDKLNVQGHAREAVCSEAFCDWSKASELYKVELSSDNESHLHEFYTESYFSCLSKLSSWSLLNDCIRTTLDQNLDGLWKNYNLLSWFLKSEMMISLGSKNQNFKEILQEFSKNKFKQDILNANFVEELAVFDWLSEKLQMVSYRINRLCVNFLTGWSHSNQWCYNLRAEKLVQLQTLAELSSAVKTLGQKSEFYKNQNLKICEKLWTKNIPISGDNLVVWDIKLKYRQEFLRQLKEHNMTEALIKSNLALAKASLCQNNLSLAKECLSKVKENIHAIDTELKTEYDYCINLGKMVVAKLKMSDVNEGLRMYLNVWLGISNQIEYAMETNSKTSLTHLFRCNFILGQLVSAILPSLTKNSVSSEVLKIFSQRLKTSISVEMVTKSLKCKGLEYFESAKNVANNFTDCSTKKSAAYIELSKFLLKFFDINSFFEFEKCAIYILKSMSLGSSEARRLFGCVLNRSDFITEDESFDNLIAESEAVPSWTFLVWVNQILAGLTSKLFPLLKPIVLRIAKDYPNAIRYPYRLSKERYESSNSDVRSFSEQLTCLLLNDKVYENFFCSMNYVVPPALILTYNLEEVLKEAEKNVPDFSRIKSILEKLYEIMFDSKYQNFRGSVYNYWETFKRPLEELLTIVRKKNIFIKKVTSFLASIETWKLPSKRTLKFLEFYSPWLSKFHSLKEDTALELPGQYCGNHKPIAKYLVTISSFKNEVIVFNSKCKPMRISILGNDAAEHKFLIKFGEDLRQDERIQQVFGHFNHILRENKQTRISVDTYKVIPLSFSLGMIEWIESNVSFHDMIESSLGTDFNLIGEAQEEHLKFLAKGAFSGRSTREVVDAYLIGYEAVKRDAAISQFNVRVQTFPQDLLKKSFWSLSTSPDHFIYLRANFATSHAVMSLIHWLIGIGDRHLQNTLISTTSGRVLGIDFGYAFGFATQLLTPPELIPFRLSPQILNLMSPLNESGWIKQSMITCLRLLRQEHFGLLSILEVFVLEPVMNWLEHVVRNQRHQCEKLESWHLRKKISMVQEKLNGANPVNAFEADLKFGHSGSKNLDKYLEVLLGVQQHNIRARCSRQGLTEEEQVECLIDLATDPHVLSKTYIGWNPWL